MDGELRDAFGELRKAHQGTEANLRGHIESVGGRVEGKLDLINKQFNQHLVDDTKAFTQLEERQMQLARAVEAAEKKRKEDSERRMQKIEGERTRADQWKLMRYAGWFAMAAALIGALVTSLLTLAEQKATRTERQTQQQQRIEDRK